MLFITPVPPGAGTFLAGRQTARAHCALLLDSLQYPLDDRLLLAAKTRHLRINALPLPGPRHAPAHQRV